MVHKCYLEQCDNPVYCKGFCQRHYMQKYRGDPFTFGPIETRGAAKDWLTAHVDHADSDQCLIWPFGRTADGRAKGSFGSGRSRLAHREMCELRHGPPPSENLEAAHSCGKGTSGCVNPNHLRWATRQENEDDKLLHGSRVKGERVGTAILTAIDVKAIRAMSPELSRSKLSARFGVTKAAIGKIVRRETWRHV